MKRFTIDYISSTDHDICHVWTTAHNEQEAIENVKDEYWDIESIVDCHE